MVKPNGISTTLLKLPKRVRHIPMLFKNARTHAIKSLSIASPQFLIIPRCLNVRLCSRRSVLRHWAKPTRLELSTLLGQTRR